MKRIYQSATIGLTALLFSPITTLAATIVFSDAGANPAAIQDTVDSFRAAVGAPNNGNVIGPVDGGRREVNWDGAPGAAAPANIPPDLFNRIVPRGIVYSNTGSGFQVSGADGNPANISATEEFGNINPTYPGIFQAFSAEKLFTTLDSNVSVVDFFIPGTTTPATVAGFGAVFTDVDLPDTTKIEYFDADNNILFSDFVTPSNEGLSFLGVLFDAGEQVARVQITTGNAPLSGNNFDGGNVDVVALDDFIYSEPSTVPEPSALLGLSLGGILPLLGWTKRRRQSAS